MPTGGQKTQQREPWDGFVIVSGYEQGHSAHQAWRFISEETLPAAMRIANPALNPDLLDRLHELTADPQRGNWQTWIPRYDLATDRFDHTFLWPGEDDGYNVLAYDTPMSAIEALNPAHPAEPPQWLTSARDAPHE